MKLDLSNSFDKNKAINYFDKLMKDAKKIELKEVKNIRSIRQNSFLHVVISLFGIETGYTIEEAKTLLKRQCGLVYHKNDKVFLMRTRDMKSDELATFIEWIRNYSASQGYYICSAEEYTENKFHIDKEIEQNKTYL